MFIYFAIKIYVTMWGNGQMVKTLGCCGQRDENSNPTLDICSWHHHGDLSYGLLN